MWENSKPRVDTEILLLNLENNNDNTKLQFHVNYFTF